MSMAPVPAPVATPPRHRHAGAVCDAHSHIFGPFDRFPTSQPAIYALPDAPAAMHARIRGIIEAARGLLVQAAPYGQDPAAMLDAIAGADGALRGVAVAGPDIDTPTLARWREGGIVGLRFAEARGPDGKRIPGSIGFDALEAMAPALRALGLHAQLWGPARVIADALPRLLPLGIPLVLDHMGVPDVAAGPDAPAIGAILDAMRDGALWVKLSVCRVGAAADGFAGARPFHDAYVDAAPGRCLWGSDWPYVRMSPAPDAGALLDLFHAWVPDEATRHAILVDNPASLYGFA
jgi:2-pyrone-4,6-dicarboxylate lactonase